MAVQIGFIGQGWIGKHYAYDFEKRGYDTIRYGLEDAYIENKERIATCDVVFIAVPTPTTPEGFDDSIIRDVLRLVGKGKIAVIKSTITLGTTEQLQKAFPDIIVLHSPEFLREASAAHDAAHPERNIVGVARDTKDHHEAAQFVLHVLPHAPYDLIMPAREAEFVKYAGNCFLYTKVIFMNLLYDYACHSGCDWERIKDVMVHDSRIGDSHMNPVHRSNNERTSGRGAGGHCFIKDFEAFREMFSAVRNQNIDKLLELFTHVNNQYLVDSEKDIDLLEGVYGKEYVEKLRINVK